MGCLIDTNVLSELQKGNRYHMFRVRLTFVILVSFSFVLFPGMTLYWGSSQVALYSHRSQAAYEAFDYYQRLPRLITDSPTAEVGVELSKQRLDEAIEALRNNAVKETDAETLPRPAELERVARITAFLEASEYRKAPTKSPPATWPTASHSTPVTSLATWLSISTKCMQLGKYVADLLFLARADTPKNASPQYEWEQVDLAGLVSSAVEDIRRMAQEHSIQVTLDAPSTPLWVRGDQQRLRQVPLILGDNACRYTDVTQPCRL